MGRYFYRPAQAQPSGLDELGGDIASGIQSGAQNYFGEQDRQKQEARQAKADQWTERRDQAWLASQGGGMGEAPRNEGTPDLDFGGMGMEAGTTPKPSPLSPFKRPTDGTHPTMEQPVTATSAGSPALAMAGGAPPTFDQGNVGLPGTRTGTSAVQDFLTSPSESRQYQDIGGAYIEDPESRAERMAGKAHSREQGYADEAYAQATGRKEQEASGEETDVAGEIKTLYPHYTDEQAHAAARSIVHGHSTMADLDPDRYKPYATPRGPTDNTKPTYAQAYTQALQIVHEKYVNAGRNGYVKDAESMAAEARAMARDFVLGIEPESGGGAPKKDGGGISFEDYAMPDPPLGRTSAPASKGPGPRQPAADPYEGVRTQLQSSGLRGQDAIDALGEAGYDRAEIEQILGAG